MKSSVKTCHSAVQLRNNLLSVLAPLRPLLDSQKCSAELVAEFHPEGPVCPACGEDLNEIRAATWRAGRRTACTACGKQFSPWSGTPLQGAHINPAEFILLRVAVGVGLDHTGCKKLLGRHGQAITAYIRRLQLHMNSEQEDPTDERDRPTSD